MAEEASEPQDDAPTPHDDGSGDSERPSAFSPSRAVRSGPRPRERLRRNRRLLGALTLLAPMLWIVGCDLLRRAKYIFRFDQEHTYAYLGSIAESLVFWAVLLFVVARRRGFLQVITIPLFVVLFTLSVGIEGAFDAIYNVYLSVDGQIHSKSIAWSIVGTLPFSRAIVWVHVLLALAVAVALVRASRAYVRATRWSTWLMALLVPVVIYAPIRIPVSFRKYQSTTPDMIYFNGIVGVVREHLGYTHDSPDLRVQKRHPESVPELTANPARPRNVLFILQESQRADVTCIEYDPACDKATPFSNKAAPDRLPLMQLRAHDSTTAISISNLWSGVRPTETRDLLHSVPLIWDYAHAAGYDTAYWTSQNLMFGNARLYVQDIPVSHFAVATNLDREAPLDEGAHDRLLTDRVLDEIGNLQEPYFAVVHYSNVHFPYVYDPENAPFQPAEFDKGAENNEKYRNYYKDVVYLSDMAVARLLEGIRKTDAGQRTVILYTSDHGESFREHWQLGHTSAIYDEEIQVPGWVDAPPGTLTADEEQSLKKAKHEFVWHLDFTPTFLDLMGIWDDPMLSPFRARMMGHPLTRPERTIGPVPLTNCTWVWECAFRNWGFMQGPMKIEAREWDGEFHCFNVLDDPEELNNLGEGPCSPLSQLARQTFHAMPNITPPGRPVVNWGK